MKCVMAWSDYGKIKAKRNKLTQFKDASLQTWPENLIKLNFSLSLRIPIKILTKWKNTLFYDEISSLLANDSTKQSKYEIKFNSSEGFMETARQNDERSGKFHIPSWPMFSPSCAEKAKRGRKKKTIVLFLHFHARLTFFLFIFF